MSSPRRRDPRDDAVNLANDARAVLGLAPYRLPSAIMAEMEEEPPEPYVHRHHGLIDTCRPPGFWWRWWRGVREGALWECHCTGRWVWGYQSPGGYCWSRSTAERFVLGSVP